jgi:serine O-acetyltransferase
MFDLISHDLKSQSNNGNAKLKIKIMLLNHTFHMLLLIRLGNYVDKNIPILGKYIRYIIEYLIRIVFSSDISCKAKIGGGMNIMHGHDIVIGSAVIIGSNCKIFNGVTLGNKDVMVKNVEQPIIGNNVTIGTGAKLLGKIYIGDNSIIGANSVVLINVPPNSVCVGVPAKVLELKNNKSKI